MIKKRTIKNKSHKAPDRNQENSWLYTDTVKDHFFHPRNVQYDDPKTGEFNGKGTVGSPVCGDVMTLWIQVDKKTGKIKKCSWKTFGCASAIASTSVLSEMVQGMEIGEAVKITPKDIIQKLGGLPARKIHCSVLGDQALRAAIEDYKKRKHEL
ncbi:MAG: iron-sulfur cluster assembly scaffold protein [Candidatus Kuenenbacteria bacterium]